VTGFYHHPEQTKSLGWYWHSLKIYTELVCEPIRI